MKRILSLFFSIAVFTMGIPWSAFAAGSPSAWEGFDVFSAQVTELLNETWEDTFLSGVSLAVGEETMTVNGEERQVLQNRDAAPFIKEEQVMVPVRTLAECEGAEITYDSRTRTAVLETDSLEMAFTEDDAAVVVNDGDGETDAPLSAAPEVVDGTLYVPLEDAASPLGYEVEEEAGRVLLTKPYQTKRLVVKSAEKDLPVFGAVQVIDGFCDLHVLQYATEDEARDACRRYRIMDTVEYVAVDAVVSAAETEGAEASSHISWGTDYIGADIYNGWLTDNTDLPQVTVAVIDTGVDGEHSFLRDRLLSNGRSYVTGETAYTDENSHGTHAAGVVVDATLPNVKILPIKVLNAYGRGSSLAVLNGMVYALEQGCDVINMSLGSYGKSDLEADFVKKAKETFNVTVVVAAGNESLPADRFSPACIEEAVTVGALAKTGTYASYSNYGDAVDLWAPGSFVRSSLPGNKYGEKSGTSFACPLAAAAAAMLKTYDSDLAPRQIEGALQSCREETDIGSPDGLFGHLLSVANLSEVQSGGLSIAKKPEVSPAPGIYTQETLTVTLSCATPGAVIRYTTDGTVPTASSGQVYRGPISLQGPTRLMARAYLDGALESYLLDGTYYLSPYPESLHNQEYPCYDVWNYTCPDTTARYLRITFDEKTDIPFPEAKSPLYEQALEYDYGLTIYDGDGEAVINEYGDAQRETFVGDELQGKSITVKGNHFSLLFNLPMSDESYGFKVKSVEPLFQTRLSAPVFKTAHGNRYVNAQYGEAVSNSYIVYGADQSVTLSSPEGAEIRYTLDGSLPTEQSALYTGPILLTEPTKIRARAFRNGYLASTVATEVYYASPYPESLHGVKREYYYSYLWEYNADERADSIDVTFDRRTSLNEGAPSEYGMKVRLYKENSSGGYSFCAEYKNKDMAGKTVSFPGNSFRLQYSGKQPLGVKAPYGFRISRIVCHIPEELKTPPVVTAPTAKELTYNGKEQELVEAGTVEGGTMAYSLSEDGEYGEAVPSAVKAGTYTVWYRVTGDETHASAGPASVEAAIAKAPQPPTIPEDIRVEEGTALADIFLPHGWFWKDSRVPLAVGENQVPALYYDSDNYENCEYMVTVNVDAHVHTLVEVEAVAASCTEDGHEAYWHCSGCNKDFADENGETPTTMAEQILQKLGHLSGEWEVQTPATTSMEGVRHKVCTRCGVELERESIPKLTPAPGPSGPPDPVTTVDPDPAPAPGPSEEPSPVPAPTAFSDVAKGDWYYDPVCFVVSRGLFYGTGKGMFSPGVSMSRGMMMTVLARLDGQDTSGSKPYYAKAMAWAVEAGISDGTDPNGTITREQLASMLYRYAGKPRVSGSLMAFHDAGAVSSYAEDSIRWAVGQGIISGKGNGVLDPKGSASRAEVASMLMRFAKNQEAPGQN